MPGKYKPRGYRCPFSELLNENTRFGRLTVLQEGVPKVQTSGWVRRTAVCLCDCGKTATVTIHGLKRGDTRSCGCLKQEGIKVLSLTHGHTSAGAWTPEYRIWAGIKKRCESPKFRDFPQYGGRGIKLYPPWRRDFLAFFAYVGPKPTPAHSIERIDNDGNYEPGNVKWGTKSEQARNTRRTQRVCFDGVMVPVIDVCERLGVNYQSVRAIGQKEHLSYAQVMMEFAAGKRKPHHKQKICAIDMTRFSA